MVARQPGYGLEPVEQSNSAANYKLWVNIRAYRFFGNKILVTLSGNKKKTFNWVFLTDNGLPVVSNDKTNVLGKKGICSDSN